MIVPLVFPLASETRVLEPGRLSLQVRRQARSGLTWFCLCGQTNVVSVLTCVGCGRRAAPRAAA